MKKFLKKYFFGMKAPHFLEKEQLPKGRAAATFFQKRPQR